VHIMHSFGCFIVALHGGFGLVYLVSFGSRKSNSIFFPEDGYGDRTIELSASIMENNLDGFSATRSRQDRLPESSETQRCRLFSWRTPFPS
jgi:hypothetical protein